MKFTILLVDDSRLFRTANHRALVRAGYEVIDAEDGQRGLELAQQRLPDLILLDMMLPKLSGPEVLRELKSDPRTRPIPIIVLTAALSEKNKKKLEHEGAANFVEKSDDLLRNNSAALVKVVQQQLLTRETKTD